MDGTVLSITNIQLEVSIWGNKKMLIGNTWEHLWYLYMLLGIYLILPILHTYVHVLSYPCMKNVNQMLIFALLTFFFTSLLPSMKWSLGINFPLSSVYVGYLLISYLLSTESIKNKLARVCDAVYITIIVMTFLLSSLEIMSNIF